MVFTVPVAAAPVAPDRFVSGEAVELDVRVAGVGSRVLARMVDLVVQIGLYLALTAVTTAVVGAIGPAADRALIEGIAVVVAVVVLLGYPTVLETVTGGHTMGKLALGLRVVRDDGGPVRFRHALTRNLVCVTVEWPGLAFPVVTWAISLGTMLANPRAKRLGDFAAGTMVIHERTPAAWGRVPAMPPQLAQWARLLDLTGLDDDLALAVRHFLARNRTLREPVRTRLGYALAAEVAGRTTPPPPPGIPGWAYLAAVLAERNRRAASRLAAARTVTASVWPDPTDPPSADPVAARASEPPSRPAIPTR
jgi:uncharacterized RDD family membrane protein YckC